MNNLTIRQETEKDYRAVEELTREAFWNVYKPGKFFYCSVVFFCLLSYRQIVHLNFTSNIL